MWMDFGGPFMKSIGHCASEREVPLDAKTNMIVKMPVGLTGNDYVCCEYTPKEHQPAGQGQ